MKTIKNSLKQATTKRSKRAKTTEIEQRVLQTMKESFDSFGLPHYDLIKPLILIAIRRTAPQPIEENRNIDRYFLVTTMRLESGDYLSYHNVGIKISDGKFETFEKKIDELLVDGSVLLASTEVWPEEWKEFMLGQKQKFQSNGEEQKH